MAEVSFHLERERERKYDARGDPQRARWKLSKLLVVEV